MWALLLKMTLNFKQVFCIPHTVIYSLYSSLNMTLSLQTQHFNYVNLLEVFFLLNSDRWLVVGHTGAVLLKVNLFFKRVAAENPRGSQASLHILLRCEKLYSY